MTESSSPHYVKIYRILHKRNTYVGTSAIEPPHTHDTITLAVGDLASALMPNHVLATLEYLVAALWALSKIYNTEFCDKMDAEWRAHSFVAAIECF